MTSITDHADGFDCDIDSLNDTVVAIDGNIQLYQFLTAMRRNGDLIRNGDDEPISHLLGMFNRTTSLLEHGVKPVYVFDGGFPDLKANEVAERAEARKNAQEKYEEAKEQGDEEAMERYGQSTARITDQIQSETEMLLDCLGVPYLTAPSEADPQLAQMVSDGTAQYAGTEDFDTLVHGADAIIRSFNGDGGQIVSLQQILDDSELSYEELVWATIASGCDYNDSPWRVGWVRAKNMAMDADSWDELVEAAYQRDVDKDREPIDRDRWHRVKAWFDDPTVDTTYSLDFRDPQPESIREFLIRQKGIGSTQVNNAIDSIL